MALKILWRTVVALGAAAMLASAGATLVSFPWNTDPRGDESFSARDFYKKAYGGASKTGNAPSEVAPLSAKEQYYVDIARGAALEAGIPREVDDFVAKNNLKGKRVLEVGAGSGLLQDAVADYTGLDISPTARRFFHKPFVEASATEMPFPDNSFDGLWTIWVIEHIPNPEKALLEMRRVVKPGGYLLLHPYFEVSLYASQGYGVRPYRDFDWKGKLIKSTIPLTESKTYHYLQYHQILLLRSLAARLEGGPSRLHFIRLTPNYDQYWVPDSDATTSLTLPELQLWFTTRGDRCLDCASGLRAVLRDSAKSYLTIQVVKN